MALATNAAIQAFDGTGVQTAISASGGSQDLASGAYSAGGSATHSVIDNSSTLAPAMRVVLVPGDGWTGTITTGGVVLVWVVPQDVDSTSDMPNISSTYQPPPDGILVIDTASTTEPYQTVVSLIGVKKFKVNIKNETGATLDDDGANGWQVKVELLSLIPAS